MFIYLKRNDPTVDGVIRAGFPGFTGQGVHAVVAGSFRMYGTNWDEGSKREYRVVQLDGLKVAAVPDAPWCQASPMHDSDIELPPGFVVVVRVHFRGRESIELIANQATISPMLPAPDPGLDADQRTVLVATRSFKSSYGGESNHRFKEASRQTGITSSRWDAAKSSLIAKRLLTKAGAITVDGRNVAGNERFF